MAAQYLDTGLECFDPLIGLQGSRYIYKVFKYQSIIYSQSWRRWRRTFNEHNYHVGATIMTK